MNKHLIAIAATAIALTGCATQPPAGQAAATEDLNGEIAKTCTATPIDLSASATANATIDMTNDGWCAVHAKENGKPFQLGLVRARPQHGRVLIQKIGGETRIEYTAENNYVGADRFTVALRSSTPNAPDATVQIAVNVTMGAGMAAAPAPAPAATKAAAPSTRSTTTRRTTRSP